MVLAAAVEDAVGTVGNVMLFLLFFCYWRHDDKEREVEAAFHTLPVIAGSVF